MFDWAFDGLLSCLCGNICGPLMVVLVDLDSNVCGPLLPLMFALVGLQCHNFVWLSVSVWYSTLAQCGTKCH